MRIQSTLALVFVMGGLLLPLSCTSDAESFCDAKCSCEVCNDFDYDRCVRDYEFDADKADFYGCYDYFEAYSACIADFGCRGGKFEDYCKPERARWRACVP